MGIKIANTEREWWDFIKQEWIEYNDEAHHEDQMPLSEYVGEMTGYDSLYGYKVEADCREYTGYRLVRNSKPLET